MPSRWTSFVADGRALHEEGNEAHRLRVEHDRETLLIHLSGEEDEGWTVFAVDRATRRSVVAQARRQIDAAREAYSKLRDESAPAQLQPELWVADPAAAIAFYERAFGAVVEHRVGAGTEIVAQLQVAGARFWVANASDELHRFSPGAIGGTTSRTLLVVDDPAATFAAAVAAGATATSPVQDEHGWLLGRVVDPFGHEWEIGRPQAARQGV